VTSLSIGGKNYNQRALVGFIDQSTSGDMTYVMAAHLIATKLNLLIGTNPTCISSTVSSADSWLGSNRIGSNVSANSAAWQIGEPLKDQMDGYNNGLLCAPSRG
jgi:hypothetical protein